MYVCMLFVGYTGDNFKFKEWKLFMDIIAHIKTKKKQGDVLAQVAKAANMSKMIQRQFAGTSTSEI